MSCSHWANVPEAVRRLFWLFRRLRLRRLIVKLNEWRPGHQPRPRLQTILEQRTPLGTPQNKTWRWHQAQFFNLLDPPNSTRTEGSTKTQGMRSRPRWLHRRRCSTRVRFGLPPSTHPRNPESDYLQASALGQS